MNRDACREGNYSHFLNNTTREYLHIFLSSFSLDTSFFSLGCILLDVSNFPGVCILLLKSSAICFHSASNLDAIVASFASSAADCSSSVLLLLIDCGRPCNVASILDDCSFSSASVPSNLAFCSLSSVYYVHCLDPQCS